MDDDDRLLAESLEIERLLDELRELAPQPVWDRIERVIGRVVRLHGAALGRTIKHARGAGASGALDEALAQDDLVASVLLLHGLHPLSVEERVRRTLVGLRTELGLAEHELVLVEVAPGRIELSAPAGLGGAMSARVAEAAIRRAIESVAPDAGAVVIGGLPPAPDPSLVQLRTRREVR